MFGLKKREGATKGGGEGLKIALRYQEHWVLSEAVSSRTPKTHPEGGKDQGCLEQNIC